MSQSDTCENQRRQLERCGLQVGLLETLVDFDNFEEALAVAAEVPGSRFAGAVAVATKEMAVRGRNEQT